MKSADSLLMRRVRIFCQKCHRTAKRCACAPGGVHLIYQSLECGHDAPEGHNARKKLVLCLMCAAIPHSRTNLEALEKIRREKVGRNRARIGGSLGRMVEQFVEGGE
jgi:hypothetical protein